MMSRLQSILWPRVNRLFVLLIQVQRIDVNTSSIDFLPPCPTIRRSRDTPGGGVSQVDALGLLDVYCIY